VAFSFSDELRTQIANHLKVRRACLVQLYKNDS
jgi:hypothetical protein